MPFLSRKRKRRDNDNEQQLSENSTSPETARTVNDSIDSMHPLDNNSIHNCLNRTQLEEDVAEGQEMDEPIDEPMSNRWADDVNQSLAEPSFTQIERNVEKQNLNAIERAKQNVFDCGAIESITLHNFMCHSNFHLDFGPRINFIVGRNGSGKSALLNGVVIGLGGRATTTNRGKGIASFIKSGETQAKIICKICNWNRISVGKHGFNFDDYGKSIIIERTIYSTGSSSYKIKALSGRVVSDRKEILDDIVRHFNIQIENPICVLNQEVSRNFLNTKNPRDKYLFFMKATLLEDMKNDYAASETERNISRKILDQKMKIIPETTKDVKTLERKVKMFNDLENHKEKFTKLNNEAIWALIYEERHKLDALKSQIQKLQSKVDNESTKITTEKETVKKLEKEKSENCKRLQNLLQEVEGLQNTHEDLKKQCNDIRDEVRDKESEERKVRTELMVVNRDVKSIEHKIKDLEQQFSDESHTNRKIEILKLNEDINRLREEENKLLTTFQELESTVNTLGEERVKLDQDYRQLSYSVSSKAREIERLNQSRNESLKRFGANYPVLVNKINEAHSRGRFKHKPLGPIGNHIQLKDYSCALAVEICLKRSLYAFCCDNMTDTKVLEEIMKSVFRNERTPTIITRRFAPLHDVTHNRVQSNEYKSLLDLMAIKESPIANCLIDQFRVEQILYIPDYKKAEELLMSRTKCPINCFQAYTMDGCVMYPNTRDSDYKTYANNRKRNANILIKSVVQMLGSFKEELNNLEQQKKSSENELNKIKTLVDSKRRELSSLDVRKKQIRTEVISKDTKLKELEAIGDSPPVEISTLEEELQEFTSKRNELNHSLDSIKAEKEVLHNNYTEADKQMRAKEVEYKTLLDGRHPMKEKLDQIKNDILNHNLVVTKYEKQLNETMAQKEEEDNRLLAKESELENDERTAIENTGKEVPTKRSSKTVCNEIKQLESFLNEQENSIGNKEEIYKKYRELRAHYSRIKEEVTAFESHLNKLKESLDLRRRGYIELRNFYSMMTKVFFMDVLKHKGFNGSLDIYHNEKDINGEIKKAKTLEIKVNPKSDENSDINNSSAYSDTRSLSGGERSYSTVAFILALWESAQSPFKILDEVDVFMDMVTRKISLDAMIEFATQKSGKQYIFLSPLTLQNLPSPDLIKIFQMPEPKRI